MALSSWQRKKIDIRCWFHRLINRDGYYRDPTGDTWTEDYKGIVDVYFEGDMVHGCLDLESDKYFGIYLHYGTQYVAVKKDTINDIIKYKTVGSVCLKLLNKEPEEV